MRDPELFEEVDRKRIADARHRAGLVPSSGRRLHLARELGVPLEIVTEKLAILGQSGAGKTYTAMRLAELLLQAGLQVVILDLVGCWWGLRAGEDGKRGGLPILVIGGQHGDLPLSAGAGAPLARLIVERRLSVVVDASELEAGDLFLFARDFAQAFFAAKKGSPSPVHVLLEEAHELLAEDPLGKEGAAVHAAWVRICKLGRNYGIGYTLVSQEPQALSKRALGQVGTMIAMRTQGDYAQRVVLGWAKTYLRPTEFDALKAELPAMATGEAFIASPFFLKVARRDHITRRETFDSSRTPEIGEALEPPATLAQVEVQQLREQFAGLVEQLEQEDTAALQRRVKELERELAAAKKAQPPPPAPPKVPTRVLEQLIEAGHQLEQATEAAGRAAGYVAGSLATLQSLGAGAADASVPAPFEPPSAPVSPRKMGSTSPDQASAAPDAGAGELSGYARDLLGVAAGRHPLKLTAKQLGLAAGRSHRSSTFQTATAALKRAGAIQETGGLLQVSPRGLQLAGVSAAAPLDPAAAREQVLNRLEEYSAWLLRVLLAEYPASLARWELGAKAGRSSSSSSFQGAVSTLKRNGLVVDQGGRLSASADLFGAGERAA
jgi:hypothetical protein